MRRLAKVPLSLRELQGKRLALINRLIASPDDRQARKDMERVDKAIDETLKLELERLGVSDGEMFLFQGNDE